MSGNIKYNKWINDDNTENYKCRAWVNFNGTGTVAIRASGGVSSITDGGTGSYTVNFTTAMPDANYAAVGSSTRSGNDTAASTDMNTQNVIVNKGTSSYVIRTGYPQGVNSNEDSAHVSTIAFR